MAAVKKKEKILLGKWDEKQLDRLLQEASAITNVGRRIAFISEQFLRTKYKPSTLIGDADTPEVFVINLDELDCFTLLEYVEAMRRAGSFAEFRETLMKVRYRSGAISFQNRAHFFTDWKSFNPNSIVDVTRSIGAKSSVGVVKNLNKKEDGTYFLPGISPRVREFSYIPAANIDDVAAGNLRTGDYAGIYSKKEGLDVSHVGIIIKKDGALIFRHASSLKTQRKVIDEDLRAYLESKDGIIIFRPAKQ
ncbi:MAG: DUF1460 domain-containing protein [Nitrospirota bacterium]|nr:DUF1460 domain-containing protein [Nitrospirota bacterium]